MEGSEQLRGVVREVLEGTILKQLLPERAVISARASDTVAHALSVLTKASILSMPVWDEVQHQYKGMVDMQDIIALCLDTLAAEPRIEKAEHNFDHLPITKAINFSRSDVYMPMEEGVSLYHAIEILTRGIHRVPVVAEEGGPIVNIVSQSSVVRFLAQHEEFISSLEARSFTWKTLKVSHDKPFAVTKADTAVTAFRILSEHQADALAIVDKHGAFRASLSISDLRGLTYDLFERLQLPVLQFVKDQARQSPEHVLTAGPEISLTEALRRLSERGAHRIWILDEERKPIGIFSLTDVMKGIMLATNPARHIWEKHAPEAH